MNALARDIYQVLRLRTPGRDPRISYSDLVRLPTIQPYGIHYHNDERLDEALGQIIIACRARALPALSAIVVHKDTKNDERYPGPGYYPIAHPEAGTDRELQVVAWGREFERACSTTYPNGIW